MVFKPADGSDPVVLPVFDFKNGGGVGMAMYNTDEVMNIIFLFNVWFISKK